MNETDKLSRKVTISNTLGIHARPAAKIAQMAKEAHQSVWIFSQNTNLKADAASVIDILSLCGRKGDSVFIQVDTVKDLQVLEAIIQFFESGFGEE